MPSAALISSLIVAYTSLMMPAGVEAPAVRPATEQPLNQSGESPSASSTWKTRGQLILQISVKCLVFALLQSPTTTITSTLEAISAASV